MSPTLGERDRRVIWHPATHLCDQERAPPLAVERAEGPWLWSGGRRILDAISSWWACVHGHAHPALVAAVRDQVARLDHVMFAGFTHEPAVALAERLVAAAPAGFGKVFYADCGAAAVEVALKLSFQSRRQRGEPARRRFAALANAYHGETLGALSTCGDELYRGTFAPLLADVLRLPCPAVEPHEHADLATDAGADTPEAEEAIRLLRAHADELTAVVIEPLVQCAGRMRTTGAGFYRRVADTAQSLGIHVIADEIAVAFFRTGRLFASDWAGVRPDLLCLGKALSGGILPLACTLVRAGFEADFAESPARSFMHSHTFTANPIACAAGLASLDVFARERAVERLPGRIERLAQLRRGVADSCPAVVGHRQAGMIAALRVAPRPGRPAAADGRLGLALRLAALERGVLLRPLHDTIYWMPPLWLEDDELALLGDATRGAIQAVLG